MSVAFSLHFATLRSQLLMSPDKYYRITLWRPTFRIRKYSKANLIVVTVLGKTFNYVHRYTRLNVIIITL